MLTAEVNGLRIAYERAGRGPALVLLHGIGGNARSWRHQLAGLADEFTAIAWDAPGYGGSSNPPTPCSMAHYAQYLAGLLDHVGLERAHLVGLSWGGVLAQEFYGRYPARVASLVLADTHAGGSSQPPAQGRARLQARLHALATMTPAEIARLRAPELLSERAPDELRDEVASIMAQIHPLGYRLAAIALAEADEREVLPRVRVPTLVVCGELDRVTPLHQAEQLQAAIPGAELAVIAGAGHASNQEQPARFNAAVREFLRRVDGGDEATRRRGD
ncbi:MAG: alpha/beta fold hydrolase, partial [Chloroflexi bacterium]|nr:alpha/beta fold hydrolase [Chloroflexota bacterium]